MSPEQHCAVCGRTILAGERTRSYISPKDGMQTVCELCRERAERLGWVDPTAPGADVGRKAAPADDPPAAPSGPDRMTRAVERFNASESARTVAGLMRTLGEPSVSVGSAAGSPSEVRITVAWELSWYQWGVDVADEGRPVFQLDKGNELTQLDGSARQWNAGVGENGRLHLGARAPSGRPDGERVR